MAEVLESETLLEPWQDTSFRADLAAYAAGEQELSRRYAEDAVLLARMAARVPRVSGDTRGATAWTSFLAELAVARRTSTQAAAGAAAEAQQLVTLMPRALQLLRDGTLAVGRARALLDATRPCDDDLVRVVDRELADQACLLPPARVRSAVDRLALQHGVDVAAARTAGASATRGTRRTPLPDGQAELAFTGPALALAQAHAALDADARAWLAALRGTGDTRGIDQLRFDLGVGRLLGRHAPVVTGPTPSSAGTTAGAVTDAAHRVDRPGAHPSAGAAPGLGAQPDARPDTCRPCSCPFPASVGGDSPDCLPSLPDPSSPSWSTDRRFSRPVRLDVTVPVTTLLGLTDEPGWLPGYGWVSAPQVRQLLPLAELRQACVAADGPAAGQLVDLDEQVARPGRTPAAARAALLGMLDSPFRVTGKTWRAEPHHDPSPALAEFVRLRDRHCDGPVGARPLRTQDADLDHDKPYDHDGPHPHDPTDPQAPQDHGAPVMRQDQPRARRSAPPAGPPWQCPAQQPVAWPDDSPWCDDDGGGVLPESPGLDARSTAERVWARHGDLGLDLDPRTGWLTLVDLGHEDVVLEPAQVGPAQVGPVQAGPVQVGPAQAGPAQTSTSTTASGPTAAWNLVGRGRRPHGLKHRGWTALRTATSTLWLTPAGQTVEVPHELHPVGLPRAGRPLPDPDRLHEQESALLRVDEALHALPELPESPELPGAPARRAAERAAQDVDVPAPF